MAHVIEPAKSGRAACRTCRQPIAKGELRFGEEQPNMFDPDGGPSYGWHHLACAAKKRPNQLKLALDAFAGDVPNRAELEKTIGEGASKQKPATFPYGERASTGRAKCIACAQPIAKGELRIAVEREVETASFMAKSAGYLHPSCAPAKTGDAELLAKVKKNSYGLAPADVEEIAKLIAAAPPPPSGGDDGGSDEGEGEA